MARVVTFGLMVATVLTLVVVPVLYSVIGSMNEKIAKWTKPAATATALFIVALIPWNGYTQEKPAPEEQTDAPIEEKLDQDAALRVQNQMRVNVDAKRSLSLEQSLAQLGESNLDLKTAQIQIEIAQSRIRQAYSTVFPTLSASGSYTINQEEIVADFGSPDPSQLPAGTPAPEPIVIQPKSTWQWGVAARLGVNFQALPLIKAAYLQRDISQVREDAIRHGLETAVIETYYSLLTIRSLMRVSLEQVESAQVVLNASEKRKAAGAATDFEVTRARLRLVQAEKDVERSKLQFKRVREVMAKLLNTEADFDVEVPVTRSEVMDPELTKSNAISNRTEIQIAKMNETFTDLQVDQVYYKYLPSLAATFRFGGQKGTALSPSEPRWALVFSAEWLLWDGGFREAELKQKKAERIAAGFELEKQAQTIKSDIDITNAEYLSALNQLERVNRNSNWRRQRWVRLRPHTNMVWRRSSI